MDTLLDGLRLIPFLFIAFLIIELIEHKLSNKSKNIISKAGRFGPFFGSLLGGIPQCGFSVLTTNLYVTRIVSLGTLIAVYLSTSDEMIPVMLSQNTDIKMVIGIVIIKIVIGMLFGFIIDFILRKKKRVESVDYEICHDDNCHCDEHLLLSVIKHTISTTLFIMLITFLLNLLIEYTGIFDSNNVIANNPFTVFITSLIGLIPNCASSVMITTLFTKGVISYAALISGLLTNSGVGILVLFKSNKDIRSSLFILLLLYIIGVICGVLFEVIGVII